MTASPLSLLWPAEYPAAGLTSDVDALTPESLKVYLDGRLGADARHNALSYEDAVEVLRRLGLRTIARIEACIAGLDGDRIDRLATGGRSGQIYRFELLLEAALGEVYVRRHPWSSSSPLWVKRQRALLRRLERAGIAVGSVGAPPMTAEVGAPVEQVAASMDAPVELVPLLPYLFEDVWQIGGPAEDLVPLLRSAGLAAGARVLDLGCGKGAAALALVGEIGVEVDGVDAMPSFIREAERVAAIRKLPGGYTFRCGDVHEAIAEAEKAPYDAVMLLALGRILGSVTETVAKLRRCVRPGGLIVLHDAFATEGHGGGVPGHEDCAEYEETLRALTAPGDVVAQELLCPTVYSIAAGEHMQFFLRERAKGTMFSYPELAAVIRSFLARQEAEARLEGRALISATWVLRRAADGGSSVAVGRGLEAS